MPLVGGRFYGPRGFLGARSVRATSPKGGKPRQPGRVNPWSGYVSFFLLDDLVTDDHSVKFFVPFDDFYSPSVPSDVPTYWEYRRRSIEFIEARNRRIKQLEL